MRFSTPDYKEHRAKVSAPDLADIKYRLHYRLQLFYVPNSKQTLLRQGGTIVQRRCSADFLRSWLGYVTGSVGDDTIRRNRTDPVLR